MKILKTNEGNIALILSPDEVKQMLNAGEVKQMIPDVPVWESGFHKNTIEFIRELKMIIGSETVKRNDPRVKLLVRKYYITALVDVLRKLNKNGYAEFTKIHGAGQGSSIGTFKLKF